MWRYYEKQEDLPFFFFFLPTARGWSVQQNRNRNKTVITTQREEGVLNVLEIIIYILFTY